MKYKYFNLINDLKNTLVVEESEPSVNTALYNQTVNNLSWYGLPRDIKKLIDLINHSSIIIENKVSWYNVREKAEEIYNNFN